MPRRMYTAIRRTINARSRRIEPRLRGGITFRIAFRVASNTNSRVVLDTTGAENLLGRGDMLFRRPSGEIVRLQELRKVNRSVRPEEIELLVEEQRALDEHLMSARIRLDAIRLIQRGWPQ